MGKLLDILKGIFEDVFGNLGFNKVMELIVKNIKISRGMAFNIISEMVMATLIAIHSVGVLILQKPDESIEGIRILLFFALVCFLFVVTERFWVASDRGSNNVKGNSKKKRKQFVQR